MQTVVETPHGLTFHQWVPPWLRVVLFLGGLLTLVAPYELLIRPGMTFSTVGLIPLLISLGALSIGAFCFWVALVSPSESLAFDARSRRLIHSGAKGSPFEVSYPFEAITGVALVAEEWETRDDTWRIEIRLSDGKRIRTPDFVDLSEADAYANRLRALVHAGNK